jgi:hypothetical protein
MTSNERNDTYYRAVEEEFVRRRGAAMLLSPRDWGLIGEWKDAGIPLRVVLQAIDNIFDGFERRSPAGRRINSLSYCRQEVLALHDIYRTLHAVDAGRPREGEEATGLRAAARHLGRLLRRVRASMAGASETRRDLLVACLARVASDLRLLRREIKTGVLDPQLLEERLRRFDEELLGAARASLSEAERSALEDAAGKTLGPAGDRMTPTARDGTRHALLARLLRDATALPRLTLFD